MPTITLEVFNSGMKSQDPPHTTICVVGLGYVGYPLACAFADKIQTIGYDKVRDGCVYRTL
jgi:UDP-N-acetyl-D-mannosaminuronate dehydrogenase